METCARCGATYMPGVSNCPGCGWPAGKAYTPPPQAEFQPVVVVEDEGFVFDQDGNPQFAPAPESVTIAEPTVQVVEPVPVQAVEQVYVAPEAPLQHEVENGLVPQPWSRAGSPATVAPRPQFSWGWAVLGFCLPPVGLIYGFAGRARNPSAAHAALIGGLIGLFFMGFGGILW